MTTGRLSVRLTVTLAIVAVVTAAGTWVVPDGPGRRLYGDAAQLAAGVLAAYACFAGARDRSGALAAWRVLIGAGLTAWAATRVWWVVRDVADPLSGPGRSGFLILPAAVFAGLLCATSVLPRPARISLGRDRVVLVIDSILVTGSLVALVWSLVPLRVVDEVTRTPWTTGVAAAYPVADLLLTVMAVLLLITRPAWQPGRAPLGLVAAGMLAFGASDLVRLLQLSAALPTPVESAGHLLGPALLGLAALSNPGPLAPPDSSQAEADWTHLLLPYLPVIASGVVIVVRTGSGAQLTAYEAFYGWLGLGLVVARQMLTIAENSVLLARVSEGRQRLRHQAYHDSLTGLANRALFRERLGAALEAYRLWGQPVALIFADLDDFKLINDSYGHAAGDRLLRAIGERLAGCTGRGDLVARLGGDEFAVLLDHHAPDAEPIAERILAVLREPFLVDGRTIVVSASVGLVQPEPGDQELSADSLLRRADAAMYASKRRGKNALARYTGAADGGPHADLPHLLLRALSGNPAEYGFQVHYQPIVRLSDGAVVAVEALARWTDPIAGPVDPDVFVTVAERTGLVAAVDDFVLDRACADMAALAHAYGHPVDVHVNVSAARLAQPGLTATVVAALERWGIPPQRLIVEITETRRIPDMPRAAASADELRAHGVRIALDDFGSGWNALAQLHSLPVDIVKLDSSLTDVDVAPERARALCRSVVTICADLDILVVAEGIETPERAAALTGLGCDLGQGYLYGQPRPVQRLAADLPAQEGAGVPAQLGPGIPAQPGVAIPAQPGPADRAELAS